MKRVIHVITDSNIGGAGKMLLSYLERYDRDKFRLMVVVPTGSLLKEEVKIRGVKCIELDGIAETSFSPKALRKLLKLFRKARPNIVHTHAALSARIAARIYGHCKIVATRHSVFDVTERQKKFRFRAASFFMNSFFADRIIAVSPAAKENLLELGAIAKKIEIVFNGVEPVKELSEDEKIKIRQKYNLAEEDFVCAIIARLTEVKGQDYVIDACKILLDKDDGIKVLIVGTGPQENHLRKMAEIIPNCIFTGFVKEIYEIENIMDIQLNASYGTEATSLSLLEGMSLGKPAVVSDFGGNPYVVENAVNGFVVEKKNAEALAGAILKLKQEPETRAAMANKSREIFNKKFTAIAMAEGIENIYERL